MQRNLILKYIPDIESIINEIENLMSRYENNYKKFTSDFIAVRAVERHLSIIGEAINKIQKINPEIQLSGVKNIIGLRNLIIHSYDSVDINILWSIIQKDIPILKLEIARLKQ